MSTPLPETGTATPESAPPSALAPLSLPVFRMLWFTWLAANISMWMNDVAAAWLMTSLTTSPILVALVQTASTLPVFLLGLPSGALADILDRKRFFLLTQLWVVVVALMLCGAVFSGWMSPPLLLAMTFANGIGLALRWPVFSAIVPELVPRPQLPAALALNGVSMNASRIIGPLVAGAVIASLGSAYVFLLNAILAASAAVVISRWKRVPTPHPLGREKLLSAMRVGLQFVAQSTHLQGVLVRICLFFFHSTALIALLPLVARDLPDGGAGTFTLLLASMGAGAIVAALNMQRLRSRWPRDALVLRGAALQSLAMVVVAVAPNAVVAALAMAVAGMAWITTANTLSVSAQFGLPDWVRARGMSMYQMAIMGASASGAAIWGQVATHYTISGSLIAAAITGVLTMLLAMRWMSDNQSEEDLTPSSLFKVPVVKQSPGPGRVLLTIEYRIDPARADEFKSLMRVSRRSRLRHGALSWELLRDINDPGLYVEQIVDESWTEHLRRFDRVTTDDVALRDRKQAFHIGDTPPLVKRRIFESTMLGDPH
ncbi:MAG: MFS transporter [Betaproteobacteria bacterium]